MWKVKVAGKVGAGILGGTQGLAGCGQKEQNPSFGGIAGPYSRTVDASPQGFRLCDCGDIHSKHADPLGCPSPLWLCHLREDPAGVGRGKALLHMTLCLFSLRLLPLTLVFSFLGGHVPCLSRHLEQMGPALRAESLGNNSFLR